MTTDNTDLVELAKSLRWEVYCRRLGEMGERKVYYLLDPFRHPFVNGRPAISERDEQYSTPDVEARKYTLEIRDTETDAWNDLPITRDEIVAYSHPSRRYIVRDGGT